MGNLQQALSLVQSTSEVDSQIDYRHGYTCVFSFCYLFDCCLMMGIVRSFCWFGAAIVCAIDLQIDYRHDNERFCLLLSAGIHEVQQLKS